MSELYQKARYISDYYADHVGRSLKQQCTEAQVIRGVISSQGGPSMIDNENAIGHTTHKYTLYTISIYSDHPLPPSKHYQGAITTYSRTNSCRSMPWVRHIRFPETGPENEVRVPFGLEKHKEKLLLSLHLSYTIQNIKMLFLVIFGFTRHFDAHLQSCV